jgi:TatD DNase family protein
LKLRAGNAVWFDSHCHLDFAAFDDDREAVLEAARKAGVGRIFVPGVSFEQWSRLSQLTSMTVGIGLGVGLHPHFLAEQTEPMLWAALEALPLWCERLQAVAIGECGLDGISARQGGAPMELQCSIFARHIALAASLELPLVVHGVGAHGLVLSMLKERPLTKGGVLHAYSGSAELVRDYTALGFYFGFGAAVTRERARRAKEALRAVPLDRLLLETDAPDQPLTGLRARNEPSVLPQIAEQIAQLRGIDVAELQRVTTENAERVFGLTAASSDLGCADGSCRNASCSDRP